MTDAFPCWHRRKLPPVRVLDTPAADHLPPQFWENVDGYLQTLPPQPEAPGADPEPWP